MTISKKIAAFLLTAQERGMVALKEKAARDRDKEVMYHYADLKIVWEAIRATAVEMKVAINQPLGKCRMEGSTLLASITTILTDEDGENWSAESEHPIPQGSKMMNLAQQYGAAVTFGRRYALCGMLSIVTGDDNDANRAFQAGAGGKAGPSAAATVDKSWQAMFEDDSWRGATLPGGDEWDFLGQQDLQTLKRAIKTNADLENPDAGLVAASASLLAKLVTKQNTSLSAALKAVKWTGTTVLTEMTAKEILMAYNAIATPKAP